MYTDDYQWMPSGSNVNTGQSRSCMISIATAVAIFVLFDYFPQPIADLQHEVYKLLILCMVLAIAMHSTVHAVNFKSQYSCTCMYAIIHSRANTQKQLEADGLFYSI